jgi:hypothetical protein
MKARSMVEENSRMKLSSMVDGYAKNTLTTVLSIFLVFFSSVIRKESFSSLRLLAFALMTLLNASTACSVRSFPLTNSWLKSYSYPLRRNGMKSVLN